MNEANSRTGTKTEDGFQAVSAEQMKQIEGGDTNLGATAPVAVSGPLMDLYMQWPRGSNDRLR